MVQASNGITNNYVYVRDFAQKKKHQTLINASTSSTNLRIFKKTNSDVFFTTISPQNYTNTS